MFVKKFEGETLDETLAMVKRELGPDAIILKTTTNKGLKGSFKKSRIEITAAISEQIYEKKAKVDHILTNTQKEKFYKAPAVTINNAINDYNREPVSSSYGNIGLNKVVNSAKKASSKIKNSLDDFLSMEEPGETKKRKTNLDQFISEQPLEAPRSISAAASTEPTVQNFSQEDAETMIKTERYLSDEKTAGLQQQVKSQSHQIEMLEKKLFELSEKVTGQTGVEQEEKGIKNLRITLRSLELQDSIIHDILKKATFEMTKQELENEEIVFEFALRELSGMIGTKMPLFSGVNASDAPVVTALVSDCAAGQMSMALKLSVLQENVKIIRFRTQKTDISKNDFTASMFKLDISTVDTLSHLMSEARKAIQAKKNIVLDLRLNFSDKDETKKFIETLKRSFDQIEVLVNISAIHSEFYNRKILAKYDQFANGVTISYVDQCLNFGSMINLHNRFNKLPLVFFGTGATVPDDLEAATAERILAGMFDL